MLLCHRRLADGSGAPILSSSEDEEVQRKQIPDGSANEPIHWFHLPQADTKLYVNDLHFRHHVQHLCTRRCIYQPSSTWPSTCSQAKKCIHTVLQGLLSYIELQPASSSREWDASSESTVLISQKIETDMLTVTYSVWQGDDAVHVVRPLNMQAQANFTLSFFSHVDKRLARTYTSLYCSRACSNHVHFTKAAQVSVFCRKDVKHCCAPHTGL